MLIQAAAAGWTVDKNHLRQRLVRVAWIAAAHAVQPAQQIAYGNGLRPDGWIKEVLKLRQENSILVVISPAHIGVIHGAENSFGRVLGMVRVTVRIFMSERRARHQIEAVGEGIGQNRRMPTVAGGKERRQIVVIRQVVLVLKPQGSGAVRIETLRYGAGGVEKVIHREGRIRKRGGAGPGCVAAGQSYIVMAFIPGGTQILGTDGRFMERLRVSSGMDVAERHVGIKTVDSLCVSD